MYAAQLFEVINEDYDDFISLSTKLVNVDSAVLRMQKPLLEIQVRAATLLIYFDCVPPMYTCSLHCRSTASKGWCRRKLTLKRMFAA